MFNSENTIEASKEFLDINNVHSLSTPNKSSPKTDANNNHFKESDQNQYENKENSENFKSTSKMLKRKLNELYESKENSQNENSPTASLNLKKKLKREPFKEIDNVEIEIAKSLIQLSHAKDNIVNNETVQEIEPKNQTSLLMTCESDVSTERSIILIITEPLKEKVTIQQYDELNPQIVSSTPTKPNLCEQEIADDLLSMCREANIQIVDNNNHNVNLIEVYEEFESPVINELTKTEIEQNKTDVKYDDNNNEEDEEPPKKLKIKMNFKQKTESPNQSEDKTETEEKRDRKSVV